jgi:adenine-specific DNA-methyltransferase
MLSIFILLLIYGAYLSLRAAIATPERRGTLSSVYAAMLPDRMRSERGVFFTPPVLVNRLLDLIGAAGFDWTHGRAIDPACGGGAFLAPLCQRIAETLRERHCAPNDILNSVADRVTGMELDPFLAWMSQVFVAIALLPETIATGTSVPTLALTGDALDSSTLGDSLGSFDLVIGNPPYGKVRLSHELRERYAASLYGHANLYGLFTHLAVDLARPAGLIGYVTPASFLGGQYFKNLRRLIMHRARPVSIDFVADRSGVFDNVLQETLLAVYRRQQSGRSVRVSAITPTRMDGPCPVTPLGSFSLAATADAPWPLPRQADQAPLLKAVAQMKSRLCDYGYTVSTGPLVWNRHKDQIVATNGPEHYPLIWAESVQAGGQFQFSSRQRNHLPFFAYRSGQDHLLLRRPCVLVQRTTAKEQQRRLIAACLPASFVRHYGAVVVENHLNVIRPRNGRPAVGIATIAALLKSATTDLLFRCINGSVAVSAFELESLSLPDPSSLGELADLVRNGASAARIEQAIERAYGVSE